MRSTSRPRLMDLSLPGMVHRDDAWLAKHQNAFLEVAQRKLEVIKNAFEMDSFGLERVLDLERVLEDMALVNRATLTAFRAAQVELADPREIILDALAKVRALDLEGATFEVRSLPESFQIPILPSHLHQVLFNVLRNALKGVPKGGGRIAVAARLNARECLNPKLLRRARKTLHITVEDNGSGIFSNRRRTAARQVPSALSIDHARKLLDLYGGTLCFEHLPDFGTRAHIIWPF